MQGMVQKQELAKKKKPNKTNKTNKQTKQANKQKQKTIENVCSNTRNIMSNYLKCIA